MIKKYATLLLLVFAAFATVFFLLRGTICASPEQRSSLATISWVAMSTDAAYSSRSQPSKVRQEARIAEEAFREIEEDFSIFRTNSLISKINATAGTTNEVLLRLDQEREANLLAVLFFAKQVAKDSGGAFDPTIGPLMRAYGLRGKVTNRPDATTLMEISRSVHWTNIQIRLMPKVAYISLGSNKLTELDLGGIAKGFAVDVAFKRLRRVGAQNFCINLGGNIRVCGTPQPDRTVWRIAVREPVTGSKNLCNTLELASGQAIATSGGYERFVIDSNGTHVSHIIDPRSRKPVTRTGSVSVIAPSAIEADACSTALFVLGEEDGKKFISVRPGCKCLFEN